MEKPSWAPYILSGAFPKELTDLLAILIIGLAGIEASFIRLSFAGLQLGPLILFLSVPLTCALASLSNTTRKLREELALFAYGGSWWQVWVRYFLRGFTCSLIAVFPLVAGEIASTGSVSLLQTSLIALVSIFGGVFYAAPSLRRIRSVEFVENYKA